MFKNILNRHNIAIVLLALFMTLAYILGWSRLSVDLNKWPKILGVLPFLSVAFFGICWAIYKAQEKLQDDLKSKEIVQKKWFASSFCIIFGVYFINWLIFWPGTYSSDSIDSVQQALGLTSLNAHHPLAFTLLMVPFLRFFNYIGNLEWGLASFSLFTALFLALVLSYTVYWIRSRTSSKRIAVISVIFFSLNPVILQYSITAWKDIWFAGFILLLCLKLGDIGINRGQNFKHRNFAIAFFVIVFGCMVFRNNGLAVALIVLFTLFVLLKRYRRVILKGTIAVLLGFIVYTGPLFSFLGVEKSSFAETVGIPIQQLAKTVVDNGTISEENEKFLKQLFDFDEIKQKYDPNIVDPVKWADSFNDSFLESNKLRFMQVWAETFPANVKSYLVAWCDITLGYWYIGANDWIVLHNGYYESELLINSEEIHITGEASQGKSLIETGGIVNPDFVEDQIDILRDVPIVGLIFNIAFLVWAVLIISYGALIERDYWKILPLTPLLLIWVSMLVAAPTFCEFRYIFAFELAVPVLLTFFVKRISPMKSK